MWGAWQTPLTGRANSVTASIPRPALPGFPALAREGTAGPTLLYWTHICALPQCSGLRELQTPAPGHALGISPGCGTPVASRRELNSVRPFPPQMSVCPLYLWERPSRMEELVGHPDTPSSLCPTCSPATTHRPTRSVTLTASQIKYPKLFAKVIIYRGVRRQAWVTAKGEVRPWCANSVVELLQSRKTARPTRQMKFSARDRATQLTRQLSGGQNRRRGRPPHFLWPKCQGLQEVS